MARLVVDRYELFRELASGGMATVYLGRLRGESGFSRTVAIKRLHAHLASNPQFVTMLVDEARLASRIRHPNVVSTVDVVRHQDELLLVMEYVHGESLSRVVEHVKAAGGQVPLPVIGAIVSGMLQGLHAAHEARDELGEPLHIVHRDVSPQNLLVGADGVARVVDFGVAKAAGRLQESSAGQVKGKVAYMAPEQLTGTADRRTDIFAASVILWELLTGQRLFASPTEVETITKILSVPIASPRELAPELSERIEELVMAGLDRVPERRFASAREMDQALHRCLPVASTFDVAEWLDATLGPSLHQRAQLVSEAETSGPASTQVTFAGGDSAAVVEPPPPRAVSPRKLGIVAAILAAVGVGAWLTLVTVHGHAAAAAASTRTGSSSEDAGSTAFAGATASPGEQTPADASAAPPLAATPSTAAAADTSSPVPAPKHVPPAASAAAGKRRTRPSVNCDPPYFINASGKHFKEECVD